MAFLIMQQILTSALLILLHFQVTLMASVVKPGCREKCGNLTIPYPFGIGKECYLAEPFEVTCDNSTNSAYLQYFETKVFHISDAQVRINAYPVIHQPKFDNNSGENLSYEPQVFSGPNFAFSRAKNKLVVLACDVYAYLIDSKTRNIVTGCASLCNCTDIVAPSSCGGVNCCQAIIPVHLTNFSIWVRSINTKARSWASNRCNNYFIVEKGHNVSISKRSGKCEKNDNFTTEDYVPVIFEWAAGNTSCKRASETEVYACEENSDCVDVAATGGYRCQCKPGYRGNAYIKNGCEDVDECKRTNPCPHNTLCINTRGSYRCEAIELKRRRIIPILLGTGTTIVLLILIGFCVWLTRVHKRRMDKKVKQRFFERNGGLLLQQHISSSSGTTPAIKLFLREDLEKATDNFNENRVLGRGGLGTVYKGMLSDGSIVAVKKSNIVDENQVGQFINEVLLLSQISHGNIVKLLGCCLETEVPLLVYEYISNGTLSYHLHDEPNASTLSWDNRLRIAAEVAGALVYLHSCVTTSIFHRDIKTSNILLSENYRAIISDFGLSRLVPINKTHLTTLVGGTFGYLDPEYFRSGQLNDKSDVYAFGVVLAELLTGQEAISSQTDEGLVHHFQSAMKQNNLFKVIDMRIASEFQEDDIVAVAKIAKRCMKLTARKRPCMKEVAAELDGVIRRLKKDTNCNQTSSSACYNSINECCSSSCTDDTVAVDIEIQK